MISPVLAKLIYYLVDLWYRNIPRRAFPFSIPLLSAQERHSMVWLDMIHQNTQAYDMTRCVYRKNVRKKCRWPCPVLSCPVLSLLNDFWNSLRYIRHTYNAIHGTAIQLDTIQNIDSVQTNQIKSNTIKYIAIQYNTTQYITIYRWQTTVPYRIYHPAPPHRRLFNRSMQRRTSTHFYSYSFSSSGDMYMMLSSRWYSQQVVFFLVMFDVLFDVPFRY